MVDPIPRDGLDFFDTQSRTLSGEKPEGEGTVHFNVYHNL